MNEYWEQWMYRAQQMCERDYPGCKAVELYVCKCCGAPVFSMGWTGKRDKNVWCEIQISDTLRFCDACVEMRQLHPQVFAWTCGVMKWQRALLGAIE